MGLREPQPPKLIKGLRSPRRSYRLRRVAATHPSAATVPSLLALLGHRTVVADPSQASNTNHLYSMWRKRFLRQHSRQRSLRKGGVVSPHVFMVIVVTHSREHKYPLQLWLKVRKRQRCGVRLGAAPPPQSAGLTLRKTSQEDSVGLLFPDSSRVDARSSGYQP